MFLCLCVVRSSLLYGWLNCVGDDEVLLYYLRAPFLLGIYALTPAPFPLVLCSKFNNYDDCLNFSYTYLNHYPGYPDDDAAVLFDDFYIDSPICCSEYDIQNGCPYPLCEEGGGGMAPQALAHRSRDASHRATAALHAQSPAAGTKTAAEADHSPTTTATSTTTTAAAAAAATTELTADQQAARRAWWHKKAVEQRDTISATHAAAVRGPGAQHSHAHTASASTRTDAEAEAAAARAELDTLFVPAPVMTTSHQAGDKQALYVAPYREYAFTQLRNKICTYDEKYGLWVKTSCHSKFSCLLGAVCIPQL